MIIIVGAGIFGSMAATLARREGHEVEVVDCLDPWSASKCSSGLTKPSWLTSLGPEKIEKGYNILRKLYPVKTIPFKLPIIGKTVDIDWIDPKKVMVTAQHLATVTRVSDAGVELSSGKVLKGKVLVAAGVLSGALVNMPNIRRLVGAAARYKAQLPAPRMVVYAPYRQAIAFNITPSEVWVGNGAAILDKNWKESERLSALYGHASKFFKLGSNLSKRTLVGARPYVEGYKGGYFKRISKNVWVSTGGAKNGTLLAAYQAKLFLEEL